mgnify:CR=1 FL=1
MLKKPGEIEADLKGKPTFYLRSKKHGKTDGRKRKGMAISGKNS